MWPVAPGLYLGGMRRMVFVIGATMFLVSGCGSASAERSRSAKPAVTAKVPQASSAPQAQANVNQAVSAADRAAAATAKRFGLSQFQCPDSAEQVSAAVGIPMNQTGVDSLSCIFIAKPGSTGGVPGYDPLKVVLIRQTGSATDARKYAKPSFTQPGPEGSSFQGTSFDRPDLGSDAWELDLVGGPANNASMSTVISSPDHHVSFSTGIIGYGKYGHLELLRKLQAALLRSISN